MNQKVVVLNAAKMDYDGLLDFSTLSPEVDVYPDSRAEEIPDRIRGACVVVTKELPVPAEMIEQFPDSVKLICEAGTGYNNIAVDAAAKRGITVCNVPAYSSHRVAHTAVMMMLSLSSTMQVQMKMLAQGNRDNFTKCLQVPHVELNGKTLGVVGAGNIGRQVIRIAQAMEMRVLCYTRTPRPDEENLSFVPLETLLRESDYISLHCPLTDKTRHMIDEKALSLMKPGAFLINTSRGGLIDEPALIRALQAGQIAGAGLDVQETEPPAQDNPLYTLDNVILTPHMGWKGLETRQRLVEVVATDIRAFFEGNPVNVVG
ncbi:MAG: NAD(P)-dependent oxidoreductase [Eubacteriales bacterium]|nr:NAD(P)-dependent oxidoreductase [Eubacteriales bacterium]